MRALVVYESMFGNTEAVARAVAEGLSAVLPTELVEVGSAPNEVTADLLVVGGPTHGLSMSRSSTRANALRQGEGSIVSRGDGIREWLAGLPPRAVPTATFDTKAAHPKLLPGSAAKSASKVLRRKGFRLVTKPVNFYVDGTKGPLVTGELNRARQWGESLGDHVVRTVLADTVTHE